MNKRIEVLSDKDISYTGIDNVFIRDNYLPEKLFANNYKKFIIIDMVYHLFIEDNNHVNEILCHFFSKISKYIHLTSSSFQNSGVYSIKFESNLTLSNLIDNLESPFGSEVGTNWTNDYFYDESGKWGIYHLHDAFCLIVGYDKSLQALVDEIFIKNLPIIKPASFFFELLTQYMNEQQKQDFIQESIRNNPWLKEVKVYSLPESDE
jgi:hypothetical protein